MIVLSVFAFFATTKGKYGGAPLLVSLVPVFGYLFIALFLATQAALCIWLRSKVAGLILAGAFVTGLAVGQFGEARWKAKHAGRRTPAIDAVFAEQGIPTAENYDWRRESLITGVCISGLLLGFYCVRQVD